MEDLSPHLIKTVRHEETSVSSAMRAASNLMTTPFLRGEYIPGCELFWNVSLSDRMSTIRGFESSPDEPPRPSRSCGPHHHIQCISTVRGVLSASEG